MYFKFLFVLYVCLFMNFVYSEKYSKFFSIEDDDVKMSEKCIIEIIRNNIQCGSLITVVTEENVGTLLQAINNDECYNVVTETSYAREQFIWKEHVVILMKDIFAFGSQIIDLTDDLLWDTNAKYIIEIPYSRSGKEIAKVLLKHNVFSAVFVDYSRKIDKEIYTYYPFKYGNCVGNYDTVESLGLCTDNVSVLNIFQNKIPDQFDKCTIKVARVEDIPFVILDSSNYTFRGKRLVGVEQFILESIGKTKGYSIDYIQVGKEVGGGVILPNGTITGILKNLHTKDADIAIGGYVLNWNRAKRFDYIWGYNYGSVSIFTPSKPVSKWKLVYKEFSWLTWIIIGAFYCLFVVVFNIYNVIATFLKDRVLLILKLWGYFYGNISSNLSKQKKIRGILMCWIWFTFFITNFYTTAFYSLTTEHHTNTRNVQQFRKSIYKPCISRPIRIFLKYTFNKTWSKNVSPRCNERKNALEIVASQDDLFSVEMQYTYKMMENKYIDAEGNPMLDYEEFTNEMTVTAMHTTRGFPLKETIETETRNLAEAGIVQAYLRAIYLSTLRAVRAKKTFKNLDLDAITVALGVLLSGLLIALITFILEVMFQFKKSCSVIGKQNFTTIIQHNRNVRASSNRRTTNREH